MLKISIIAQNLATHLYVQRKYSQLLLFEQVFFVDSDQIFFLTNLTLKKLDLSPLICIRNETLRQTYSPNILTNTDCLAKTGLSKARS